jgi:hypothetical protein
MLMCSSSVMEVRWGGGMGLGFTIPDCGRGLVVYDRVVVTE